MRALALSRQADFKQFMEVNNIAAKIEQAKKEWESTVDSLNEVVCLIDRDGKILRSNRTIEKWQLTKVTAIKGEKLHDLFHPGCADQNCYFQENILRAKKAADEGRIFENEDFDSRIKKYVRMRFGPVLDPGEKENPDLIVAIIEDISESKKLESDLISFYRYMGKINRQLSILSKLSKAREYENQEKIIEETLWSALEFSRAKLAALYQYDSGKLELSSLASEIIIPRNVKNQLSSLELTKFDELAREFNEQKSQISGDVSRYGLDFFALNGKLSHFDAYPMYKDQQLQGVLMLFFPGNWKVSDQEAELVNMFAFHSLLIFSNLGILK